MLLDPETLWPQATYVGGERAWSVDEGPSDERTTDDSLSTAQSTR